MCRLFHQHHPKGDILTPKPTILTQKNCCRTPNNHQQPKKKQVVLNLLESKEDAKHLHLPASPCPQHSLTQRPRPGLAAPSPSPLHLVSGASMAPRPILHEKFWETVGKPGQVDGKIGENQNQLNHKKCHARVSRGLMENGNVSPINTEKSVL